MTKLKCSRIDCITLIKVFLLRSSLFIYVTSEIQVIYSRNLMAPLTNDNFCDAEKMETHLMLMLL